MLDTNVDGQTNKRMDGRKIGSLSPTGISCHARSRQNLRQVVLTKPKFGFNVLESFDKNNTCTCSAHSEL